METYIYIMYVHPNLHIYNVCPSKEHHTIAASFDIRILQSFWMMTYINILQHTTIQYQNLHGDSWVPIYIHCSALWMDVHDIYVSIYESLCRFWCIYGKSTHMYYSWVPIYIMYVISSHTLYIYTYYHIQYIYRMYVHSQSTTLLQCLSILVFFHEFL